MKLSRLANLEVKKLEDEKAKLEVERVRIENILNNENLFNQELINGWRETSKVFGDARRTKILNIENESDEPVESKQLSLSLTNKGAIFITETSSLYTQRRNGVGTKFKLEKDEYIIDNVIGQNIDTILFFTNKGNYYHMSLGEFQIGEKQYLSNFFIIENEEFKAVSILSKSNPKNYIIFVTKNGIIKKSKLTEYNLKRAGGSQAIKLDVGDEIISICFVNDENIGILSQKGQFIIISSKGINAIGRLTHGIIGMKLNSGDYVCGARAIPNDTREIFSVSVDGYSKRTTITEFNITGTNTKGVKIQNSEIMCDFIPINSTSDIIINSSNSQIRIALSDVPLLGRGAQGTHIMRLSEKSKIVGISNV